MKKAVHVAVEALNFNSGLVEGSLIFLNRKKVLLTDLSVLSDFLGNDHPSTKTAHFNLASLNKYLK